MRCEVLSKLLPDLAQIFAGWTLGNFCIPRFERHDVQAHHPDRSLAIRPDPGSRVTADFGAVEKGSTGAANASAEYLLGLTADL